MEKIDKFRTMTMALSQQSQATAECSQRSRGFGTLTQNTALTVMLNKLNGLAKELVFLDAECSTIDRLRQSCLNDDSTMDYEENFEIAHRKELFTESLTDAIKLAKPTGIPSNTIQAYEALASMMEKQWSDTKTDIQLYKKQLKNIQTVNSNTASQVEAFSKILKQDNSAQNDDVSKALRDLKKDLGTVLSLLDENEKKDATATLARLFEAFETNLVNEENQYYEVPVGFIKSKVISALTESFLIVRHPSNPRKYRLDFEE